LRTIHRMPTVYLRILRAGATVPRSATVGHCLNPDGSPKSSFTKRGTLAPFMETLVWWAADQRIVARCSQGKRATERIGPSDNARRNATPDTGCLCRVRQLLGRVVSLWILGSPLATRNFDPLLNDERLFPLCGAHGDKPKHASCACGQGSRPVSFRRATTADSLLPLGRSASHCLQTSPQTGRGLAGAVKS
jgi:hypothetical protein